MIKNKGISSYREFNIVERRDYSSPSIESSLTIESMFLPPVRSWLIVEKVFCVINPSSFIQRQKWSE